MNTIPIQAIDDCWNRIGVMGDQSCAKLPAQVHCRNCEVYADAAQLNLRRSVGDGYRHEWAEHFRRPEPVRTARERSVLVFRIGREWLALPTAIFERVAPEARPHRLPHRNGRGLAGIVNVGGTLYPAMSLAALLGVDQGDAPQLARRHTFARLLVMRWEGQAFALPVADLHGIVRFGADALQAPAATINKGLSRYLSGVLQHDDMYIGCLDEQLVGHQLTRLLR